MAVRADPLMWVKIFAAAILVRPIFIVPMADRGPLGGSGLLVIGLATVFFLSLVLALGVFVAIRPLVALAILTALVGFPIAALGAYLGLPMPWPLVLGAYNLALVLVGIKAWQQLPPGY